MVRPHRRLPFKILVQEAWGCAIRHALGLKKRETQNFHDGLPLGFKVMLGAIMADLLPTKVVGAITCRST